jgi:hypothetical protein
MIESEDWFDIDKIKNHENCITINYNNRKMLDSNNKYHTLTDNVQLPDNIKQGVQSNQIIGKKSESIIKSFLENNV